VAALPSILPAADQGMEAIFMDKDDNYKKMIEASLVTTGNNYRMKKAIEKAQKGENVIIAYIGGSITEGAGAATKLRCYAYQTFLYFKETFGKDGGSNVKFINAGMRGTPSALGVIRYDRDVTADGKIKPDIVFIEFAVNDYDEPTQGAAYESLTRNILKAENQPAVVYLFGVFKTKWNMQDNYIQIGDYYNLPMISIKDAVVPELTAGRITDDQFFADDYHPTDYGHGIMADSIKYYFQTVNSEDTAASDINIPDAAKVSKAYEGIKLIDNTSVDDNVTVAAGGFTEKDTQIGTFAAGKMTFPNNWKHSANSGDDSFVMNVNCKNLLFVYKSGSIGQSGTAKVYIDDKLTATLDSTQGGGWNNPVTVSLINEETAADHKVEIKMAEGNEDKEFTIMAFGYTKY
jgi:lysophospholipase L1-like esterase